MMTRCWQCGRVIAADEATRVTVKTGNIYGQFDNTQDGRHFGQLAGSSRQRVDFCGGCAALRRIKTFVIASVLIAAWLAAFILFWAYHAATTE